MTRTDPISFSSYFIEYPLSFEYYYNAKYALRISRHGRGTGGSIQDVTKLTWKKMDTA